MAGLDNIPGKTAPKRTAHPGDRAKYLFLYSIVVSTFLLGMLAERYHYPPYLAIHELWQDAKELKRFWKWDLGLVPLFHLVDARTIGTDALTIDREGAEKGYRVISGVFPKRPVLHGAVLLDREGHELHYWPIDYDRLDPKGRGAWHVTLHGFEVFGDGSIIVNFDGGNVLARLDRCGAPIWKISGRFNHVVHRSYDHTIWTWEDAGDADDSFLVQLDPVDGRVLRRISLVHDLIAKSGAPGLFLMRQEIDESNLEEKPAIFLRDPFHPNGVAVLPPGWAPPASGFEPGDILISLRNVNFVGVFDGRTYKLKWGQNGPWHRQHDPVFTSDGEVSVFNNKPHFGESEIVRINPVTRKYTVAFAGNEAVPFYSRVFGRHQYLGNGDMLLTESLRGAAVEVNRDGQVVWEYNNRYDAQKNGLLTSAAVLPEGFFEPGEIRCAAAPIKSQH